jgi:ribosome-associated toxin RatA of RatAB toxin-antitoxin module
VYQGFFGKKLCLLAGILICFSLFGCTTKYINKFPKYATYKGEINQHTRLIRTERNQIFQILIKEEAFKEICPKGTIVTYESPLPYQVGTIIKTRIAHIFELDWTSRVEEVILDRKIRIQFLDGFFAGGMEIWELESVREYTRVIHTIIFQPKGFLRKLAWILKVRLKHNKMVEALLDNLGEVSETH